MRNIFTKTFALLTMAAMSMGVWAGDFYGSNYNQKATVPGTIELSYGSYTGWNRESFFSNDSKMENSKSGAVAQFSFTVSDAAAFLFSLQASNGNGYGDYNCDLQVKIWSASASEPESPTTTFTVVDDNNWDNFVGHYYLTPELEAGDYNLKITWTDQANVQNIKLENYESKLITPSTTALSLNRSAMTDYYFGDSEREKDCTPLGYMNVGDYIEYPVTISSSEYLVSFEASIKEGSAGVITVSLINASTDTRMEIPVDVAVSGNWSTYLSYKTWFSNMTAGVYILRVAWTSGTAANFQNLKIRDISSIVIAPSSSAISLNKADMADYKFNNALEEKDQDPLGYMTEGDYIEYPVSISNADDFFVTFKASIKDIDGAVMSVSFIEANTANVVTKTVSVLKKSGWGDYTRYVALFPELAAGSYWLRITWTTQNPNFGSLKLMSTADYTYTIGGSEVNLSTDWKTKALIEINNSRYAERDNVEFTGNNDNLNFILHNAYSSPLDLSIEASTEKDNASIVVELLNENGSVLSSETKSITRKDWSTFAEYTVTGINTTAGYQVLRLRFENNGSNVRNIKVTPKVYVRTHPHMNLNTLCFPYQIDNYEGATFYTILETEVNGSNELTKLVLEEHVGALEAGVPYFYDPEESELVCYYSGDYADVQDGVGGLTGTYDDNAAVPEGSYVTVNNQLYKCGAGVTMGSYRAYVTPESYSRPALAGRRRLTIGGNNAPTGLESIQPSEISSQKILRNGQIVIVNGDKMYNVMGQEL